MNKKEYPSWGLKVIGRLIENKADKEAIQWPPICMGFIHQPKRPKAKKINKDMFDLE